MTATKHFKYFSYLTIFVGGILFLSNKRFSLVYLDIAANGFTDNSLLPQLTSLVMFSPQIPAVLTAFLGIFLFFVSLNNTKKHKNTVLFLLLFQPVIFISFILNPLLVLMPVLMVLGFYILPLTQRLAVTSVASLFMGILFPDSALPSLLFFIVCVASVADDIDLKAILIPSVCMVAGIVVSLAVQSKLSPSFHLIKLSHTVFISFIFAIPILLIMIFKGDKKLISVLIGLVIVQYLAECFLSKRFTGLSFIFMLQSLVTYPLLLGAGMHKFKSKNMQIALISLIIFSLFITLFHFKTILEIDSFSFSMLSSLDTSSTLKIVTFSVFYVILFFLIIFLLLKDSFRGVVIKHFNRIILILLISNFMWKCIMQPLVQERKERINVQSQFNEKK